MSQWKFYFGTFPDGYDLYFVNIGFKIYAEHWHKYLILIIIFKMIISDVCSEELRCKEKQLLNGKVVGSLFDPISSDSSIISNN
jgi:hypothetical protein